MPRIRKYLDKDRTVVNPEWVEARKKAQADAPAIMASLGVSPDTYTPGEGKLIPPEGAWIIILEEPNTVLRSRFRVPLHSMWRARHHQLTTGGFPVKSSDGQVSRIYPQQAVISTPEGLLHLWAHEYVIVKDPYATMSLEGATLHQLGGEPVLDVDHLFYLQSRGIPYNEAVLLLLDAVTSLDYVYATFPEEVTSQLEGMGTPLWRHIQRSQAAARELEDA